MAKKVHITSGPILPQMFSLCMPLLIGNILQQFYNIINSLIVTRYIGSGAFAALGVAESIMNLFIYAISGTCIGASVLISRLYGEQNFDKLRQQVYISAVFIGGCTAVAVAVGQLFMPQILRLTHTPDDLSSDVSIYLRCILFGMVFTFTYNILASMLRAVGNTRSALYFLLISLGYNIVAAWILVAVMDMGILGTAIATCSAQMVSSLMCFIYIMKKQPFLMPRRMDMKMDGTMLKNACSFGIVAAMHQSSLYLGKLMVQSAVNMLGTAAISAFTAATRVENIAQAFGSSGSETMSIFIAQNRGANKPKRALKGFAVGIAALTIVGGIFSVILSCFGGQMAIPFLGKSDAEAASLAASYLCIVGAGYFLTFWGHSFVGHFRGEGRMNIPFWATSTQLAIRVIFTYLLVDRLGLDSVAWATIIGWIVIVIFHGTTFILEKHDLKPIFEKEADA